MLWTWLLVFVAGLIVCPRETAAEAPQGSLHADRLYEVVESAMAQLKKKSGVRSATAVLSGTVSGSSPICPPPLEPPCTVLAVASNVINLRTGIGPVSGTFQVLVQLDNPVDGPEEKVIEGTLEGSIDLSPTLADTPLGFIRAKWTARGVKGGPVERFKARGKLTGTFLLPFEFQFPNTDRPVPSYLVDGNIVPVLPDEYSLGVPTVRLDLELVESN